MSQLDANNTHSSPFHHLNPLALARPFHVPPPPLSHLSTPRWLVESLMLPPPAPHTRVLTPSSAHWGVDAPGASALRFPRGKLGYSTACTEVVTDMAAGALRVAKGAEGSCITPAWPGFARAAGTTPAGRGLLPGARIDQCGEPVMMPRRSSQEVLETHSVPLSHSYPPAAHTLPRGPDQSGPQRTTATPKCQCGKGPAGEESTRRLLPAGGLQHACKQQHRGCESPGSGRTKRSATLCNMQQ
jgi:hypothetical protein